jgi:DNA-directed RNA polymerase specialized sigma24 family protein
MGEAEREKAAKEVSKAQADFERQVDQARETRRKTFERAQKAGLTLREISERAGLHHTTVGEIIRGK